MHFKKLFIQIPIYTFILSNLLFTFAQGAGSSGCSIGTDDAPSPSVIACILGRIITIMLYVAASVFVGMIAYGAIKLAMASGDPEGYKGAKSTWTYAVIGVGIILGVAGVFSIIGKLFGINFLDPDAMVAALEAGINSLFQLATAGN